MMLLRALRLAFSMLTRLPLHPKGEVSPRQLRWSVGFYPWVGLVLGVGLYALSLGVQRLTMAGLAGALLTAALALVTGGLHLDGLADWFDAVGGGRGDRQRMLDIMKDSRIGAHGAVALVLLLVAKCAVLDASLHVWSWWQWIALPTLSRFAIVPLVVWMRPARNQGLAQSVHGTATWPLLLLAACPVLALLACQAPPRTLLLAALFACVVATWTGLWAQRRLGGATGDVYGAALELAELTAAITLLQPPA